MDESFPATRAGTKTQPFPGSGHHRLAREAISTQIDATLPRGRPIDLSSSTVPIPSPRAARIAKEYA